MIPVLGIPFPVLGYSCTRFRYSCTRFRYSCTCFVVFLYFFWYSCTCTRLRYTVKKDPVLGSPLRVLGMEVKREKNVIRLFFKVNFLTTISVKRSRWELSIHLVIDIFIFKNDRITLFQCFTFIPKTGMRLPKTGSFSFVCLVFYQGFGSENDYFA